jgi:hypothetical protein
MPEKQQQLYGIIRDVIQQCGFNRSGRTRKWIDPKGHACRKYRRFFLGMIQPAAIIWNLSDGEFDLVQHSKNAWNCFWMPSGK